ncbi:MAG: amidohydrolase, partial [candidate division WOR-3 bacterium]
MFSPDREDALPYAVLARVIPAAGGDCYEDGYERAATADEIAALRALVREAVAAGAAGFATSSSTT